MFQQRRKNNNNNRRRDKPSKGISVQRLVTTASCTGAATTMPPAPAIAALTTAATMSNHDVNQQMWGAAYSGDEDRVRQLLRQQGTTIVDVDFKGGDYESTPLHMTSRFGHTEVAQLLIKHQADVNARNSNDNTPLHWACYNGHAEIAQLLLEHHANAIAKDNTSRTPLHMASEKGLMEIVKLLMEHHVDVNAKDNTNSTPLHYASYMGHLGVVELLLQKGVVAEAKNIDGKTPLHYAQEHGHNDVVQALESYILATQYHQNQNAAAGHPKPPPCKSGSNILLEFLKPVKGVQVAQMTDDYNGTKSTEQQQNLPDAMGVAKLEEADSAVAAPKNPMAMAIASKAIALKPDPDGKVPGIPTGSNAVSMASAESMGNFSKAEIAQLRRDIDESVQRLHKAGYVSGILEDQLDVLNLLASDKRMTLAEDDEKRAILNNPQQRDFYCLLVQKLQCMIVACEASTSGIVASSKNRTSMVRYVQEKGIAGLRKTKIGYLVADAVKFAKKQIPFPFVNAIGSVIQALAQLNDERDRFLGVSRVADFATYASLQESDGLHMTVERFARLMVCSGRYDVETDDEYGVWQKQFLNLIMEPGCTKSRAGACMVADEAIAHLMKPMDDCPVGNVLDGTDTNTPLHEALASVILGMPLPSIQSIYSFHLERIDDSARNKEANHQQQVIEPAEGLVSSHISKAPVCVLPSHDMKCASSHKDEPVVSSTIAMTESPGVSTESSTVAATVAPDVDIAEILARLRAVEEENRKLKHHVSKYSGNKREDWESKEKEDNHQQQSIPTVNGSNFKAPKSTLLQLGELEKKVGEMSNCSATAEEMKVLRTSLASLSKRVTQMQMTQRATVQSGGLMHADFRGQYKDKLEMLEDEITKLARLISTLLERNVVSEERLDRVEEMAEDTSHQIQVVHDRLPATRAVNPLAVLGPPRFRIHIPRHGVGPANNDKFMPSRLTI